MKKIGLIVGIALAASLVALAAEEKESSKAPIKGKSSATAEQHLIITPADLKWVDAPPGLPPGAKMAVLEGDPTKKGNFTVRLQAPAGYKVPPHTHPTAEHITVISGTMNFGAGEKFDEAAGKELPMGGYVVMPAGMKHYAWSSGEAIIQIHGMGQFEIKYVNPADDPRNAKR
jgi:quercetin dioxygenase-like cupin family protein